MSDPSPPLRGNYYSESGFVAADFAAGVLRDRAGSRMLLLPPELRAALASDDTAGRVMKRVGRRWGEQFARRFEAEIGAFYGQPLRDAPLSHFAGTLATAFNHLGWGVLRLDFGRQAIGLIVAEVRQPLDDALFAGALAGVFSRFAGQELDGLCTQPGDEQTPSRFVIGLRERLARARGATHDEIVRALETIRV